MNVCCISCVFSTYWMCIQTCRKCFKLVYFQGMFLKHFTLMLYFQDTCRLWYVCVSSHSFICVKESFWILLQVTSIIDPNGNLFLCQYRHHENETNLELDSLEVESTPEHSPHLCLQCISWNNSFSQRNETKLPDIWVIQLKTKQEWGATWMLKAVLQISVESLGWHEITV